MTISVLAEAIDRENISGDLFFDWLDSSGYGFFSDLLKPKDSPNCDIGDKKRIVMYILLGYSQDSKMVISGADWTQNKLIIAEKVSLPKVLHDEVLYLQNPIVCEVIDKYMSLQMNREFKNLQDKKDLQETMSRKLKIEAATLKVKEIIDTSKMCDDMLEEINDIESMFKEKYRNLFEGKEEIKNAREKHSKPLGQVEDSKYIK